MGKNKGIIGFVLGIVVAVALYFMNIPGLSHEGHMCLTFSLMTVIFWAFGIAQPGYTSGLYLLLLAVFKVAEPTLIFSTWTTSMMYLIIGAYLIAVAVKESGLGERWLLRVHRIHSRVHDFSHRRCFYQPLGGG